MSAVPKLRFPEFGGEWKEQNFGEICSFSKGKGISKSDISEDGALPCIRYGELYTHYGVKIDEVVSRTNVPAEALVLSEGGEVIIPASGETPEDISTAAVVIDHGVALGGDLNILRTDSDGYFLASYISGKARLRLASMAQGNSVVHLYGTQIASLGICLPPLPEQQKIASFLSSVDKKIDLLRQKKDALELYKKGLMQKIFSQEIRFKQDDGSDFPDWEEVALNEIAKRSTEKNTDLELTLVLTNSAIQGVVIQTEYFDKSIANEANISGYYKVRKSDFVYNPRISSAAPVGPISQNMKEDGVMSPLYTVFSVDEPYQKFLNMHFKSSVWFDYMRSVANQGARHDRMNITTGDFMALPIDLPCAEERKKIVAFLSAIDAKIQNASSQIEQMEAFKKGLLQQMFV